MPGNFQADDEVISESRGQPLPRMSGAVVERWVGEERPSRRFGSAWPADVSDTHSGHAVLGTDRSSPNERVSVAHVSA